MVCRRATVCRAGRLPANDGEKAAAAQNLVGIELGLRLRGKASFLRGKKAVDGQTMAACRAIRDRGCPILNTPISSPQRITSPSSSERASLPWVDLCAYRFFRCNEPWMFGWDTNAKLAVSASVKCNHVTAVRDYFAASLPHPCRRPRCCSSSASCFATGVACCHNQQQAKTGAANTRATGSRWHGQKRRHQAGRRRWHRREGGRRCHGRGRGRSVAVLQLSSRQRSRCSLPATQR